MLESPPLVPLRPVRASASKSATTPELPSIPARPRRARTALSSEKVTQVASEESLASDPGNKVPVPESVAIEPIEPTEPEILDSPDLAPEPVLTNEGVEKKPLIPSIPSRPKRAKKPSATEVAAIENEVEKPVSMSEHSTPEQAVTSEEASPADSGLQSENTAFSDNSLAKAPVDIIHVAESVEQEVPQATSREVGENPTLESNQAPGEEADDIPDGALEADAFLVAAGEQPEIDEDLAGLTKTTSASEQKAETTEQETEVSEIEPATQESEPTAEPEPSSEQSEPVIASVPDPKAATEVPATEEFANSQQEDIGKEEAPISVPTRPSVPKRPARAKKTDLSTTAGTTEKDGAVVETEAKPVAKDEIATNIEPVKKEQEPELTSKKAPPPKPKKLSSKIAAFQQMFNQPPERMAPRPASPAAKGKLSSEKTEFAANLLNMMGRGIALPGMANPEMMRKMTEPTTDESTEKTSETPVVPRRARGPRGKKLPKLVQENKLEVAPRFKVVSFAMWDVKYTKKEEPIDEKIVSEVSVNEEPINEGSMDVDIINKAPIDKVPINEEPISEDTVNEGALKDNFELPHGLPEANDQADQSADEGTASVGNLKIADASLEQQADNVPKSSVARTDTDMSIVSEISAFDSFENVGRTESNLTTTASDIIEGYAYESHQAPFGLTIPEEANILSEETPEGFKDKKLAIPEEFDAQAPDSTVAEEDEEISAAMSTTASEKVELPGSIAADSLDETEAGI